MNLKTEKRKYSLQWFLTTLQTTFVYLCGMNNNDIFKKLRVALQLRDDQIVEILELVDFRISKAELGAFFRNTDHPNYKECGDQILRNFLNGLVLFLRGTKEKPKVPGEVLLQLSKKLKPIAEKKPIAPKTNSAPKKVYSKKPTPVVSKVAYKNGKKKND